ncbi:thiamine phosphate synthase [Alkanindiges sp. WGS2144]|uniref:thiamine phosphate synthase n=1 Tax=Alkanindiges sp. WGS2144 TaxID=3366808 RepID=UPI003751D890
MRGLYLITNDDEFSLLQQKLQLALDAAPIALLQYRRKQVTGVDQLAEIEQLIRLCQLYQVPLIINDQLEHARQFGCGLHLGQRDGSLPEARKILGDKVIIGRTCHASLELAKQAAEEGASYLAFGTVYPSASKPEAKEVSLAVLQQARQYFDVPVCAIGGLTVENSKPLVEAGLDLFAVIGDVLNLPLPQVAQRAQQWVNLLKMSV